MSLLSYLVAFVFPETADRKRAASASEDALRKRIAERDIRATEPVTRALLPFRDPLVAALIREAKYRENERAIALLGSTLSRYLESALPGAIIVPMPLSARRLRERGYNQCEAIAREALRARHDVRFSMRTDILARVKDTGHQARLGRTSRLSNLSGAFAADVPDPRVRYLLLDDVVTTGATMQEAIRAMKLAGATDVFPLALAYA